MNWYKLAQFGDIEIFDEHDQHYSDIGHHEGYGEYNKKTPNYMWYFFNGEIVSVQETEENVCHVITFPEYSSHKYFGGRFESTTGKLSVNRPDGIARHRPVPESILYKLYQKFPGIKQIYVF